MPEKITPSHDPEVHPSENFYARLSGENAARMRDLAEDFHDVNHSSLINKRQLGLRLNSAKHNLEHGLFSGWLVVEKIKQSTAGNYMALINLTDRIFYDLKLTAPTFYALGKAAKKSEGKVLCEELVTYSNQAYVDDKYVMTALRNLREARKPEDPTKEAAMLARADAILRDLAAHLGNDKNHLRGFLDELKKLKISVLLERLDAT